MPQYSVYRVKFSITNAGGKTTAENRFVLVGIAVLSRRRAGHGPILRGGILSLAEMPFLHRRRLSLWQIHHCFRAAARPFRGQKDRSPDDRDSVCSRDSALSSARIHAPARIESAQALRRSCGTASHRFSASHAVRYAPSPLSRSRS